MKITDVKVLEVQGPYRGPEYPPGDRQAEAIDLYPEFNAREATPAREVGDPVSAQYVVIETDDGVSGLWGPIQDFQSFTILRRLRPYLVGRDPLATELLSDQMARMDRHGRSGLFMTAVSAVDNALWDLKGKAWGQPVYRLLGGPTRSAVPAYASMLGFSVTPDAAAEVAAAFQRLGYPAQKWFFRYGPADGEAGLAKNMALARAVRAAVGEAYTLMFDAYMGWSVSYATAMLQALEPVRPFWLEEPIPPERVSEFVQLRRASRVPLATGEHIFTRWQTKELLVAGAVDVLQNDPDWTGGISELVKVIHLASAFEAPVVAHGHSLLAALHVAGAQSPAAVPYVEYLVRLQPTKQNFHTVQVAPQNGEVSLPSAPGLGLALDEQAIVRTRQITF